MWEELKFPKTPTKLPRINWPCVLCTHAHLDLKLKKLLAG
jgi:hypothetical protein